jgi:phosphomannomutase/phosphoglucomutase
MKQLFDFSRLSVGLSGAGKRKAGAGGLAKGRSLWGYMSPGILVGVLIIVLLATVTLQALQQNKREMNRIAAGTVVEAAAQGFATQLDSQRQQLVMLAESAPVRRALADGRTGALRTAAQQAQAMLPGALQLRLYGNGQLAPDQDGTAPLGYAGVDLVKRARQGGRQPAEVHQISSGRPYIAMTVPVTAEGQVAGVLFAAWPVKPILQVAAAAPRFAGEFQLLQGGSTGYVLATSGPVEPMLGFDGSVAIPGSIWELVYSVDPADISSELVLIGGLAFGGAWALLLVMLLLVRVLGRDMREDMATLVNLGEAIAAGTGIAGRGAKVSVSRDAILLLTDLTRKTHRRDRRNRVKEKRSAKPVQATERPFPNSTSMLVEEVGDGAAPRPEPPVGDVPRAIFRAYDVRGVVGKELNKEIAFALAQAFAETAVKLDIRQAYLAHDARPTSPELYEAFAGGLASQGMQVLELGQAPVALPYFALQQAPGCAAVMVTGSHNPPEYNGFKLYLDGKPVHGERLGMLRERMLKGRFASRQGERKRSDLRENYLDSVSGRVQLSRGLKVVVDGGNGVAGELACELLGRLGCDAIPLFCEPDGTFPNHHPDPGNPDNLVSLQLEVQAQEADIGIAFDGDGDRLGVIDNEGNYTKPEHVLMLLAADILLRHPGSDVVYDVKSSRNLSAFILSNGGRPVMWCSGHSRMKEKMLETDALLGGEYSGHFFIRDAWSGADDAVYVAARLLEILANSPRPLSEVVSTLPGSVDTPELLLPLQEGEQVQLMKQIEGKAQFRDARVIKLDGLRVEYPQAWGLVRLSNTTPSLTFRFEADDQSALEEIKQKFRDLLNSVAPGRPLPF